MNTLTKMMPGIILTTLLLTITGTVLAKDPEAGAAKQRHHHPRGDQPMPVVDNLMRAIKHLDLNEEQKTSIKDIMHGLKTEERPLAREMKAGQEQLKELIKADSFDEAAVSALAKKEGALAAERLIITSRAMSKVYAQLTDEQRAELATMASERAAKRAEKRAERRGQQPDNG
jgi:protein CpxP